MKDMKLRAKSIVTMMLPFLGGAIIWEGIAWSELFSPALFPPVEKIFSTMWNLAFSGVLIHNTLSTLYRLLLGYLVASVIGVTIGLAMARSKTVETFFVPLLSVLLPIPSLAWIPLFLLWFGLGDPATIALVIFSATLPIIFNTWTGVKTINEIWIKAARSMNAHGPTLFKKVIIPASLPFLVTGLRLGFAQAWRAVIAGEMIAATAYGLGVLIFTAREFLNTDVMLAGVMAIGLVGLLLEKFSFEIIERNTVVKWGMLREAGE